MIRITDALQLGEILILTYSEKVSKPYSKIKIENQTYDPIICYDLPNNIAIKACDNFVGKRIEFI